MSHGGLIDCACASSSFGSRSTTTGSIALATPSEFETAGHCSGRVRAHVPEVNKTPQADRRRRNKGRRRGGMIVRQLNGVAKRDWQSQSLEYSAVSVECKLGRCTCAQPAADERQAHRRAGQDRCWKYRIQMRAVVNR